MKSVSGKNKRHTGKEFIERKKAESCMYDTEEQAYLTAVKRVNTGCIYLNIKLRVERPICCDIGQIDIFSRIELSLLCVLSSRVTNYKNDIQLFLQLFDELSVNRNYH